MYAFEENREELQRTKSKEAASKTHGKKDIWLVRILLSVQSMNCDSFSINDIVTHLRTRHDVKENYVYQKIWKRLKENKIFKQLPNKRWQLVPPESTILETTKPKKPPAYCKNSPIKSTNEQIYPIQLTCNPSPLSLTLICAKILRCRDLTKMQLYKEISSQHPCYKPGQKAWKKKVDSFLDQFCIKFSSEHSTSYSVSQDTYINIYKNEVVHKEFNFNI